MSIRYGTDYTVYGKLLLDDTIIEEGAVAVENGIIKYSGCAVGAPVIGEVIKADSIIAPGFVDIHCHGGGGKQAYHDTKHVADHHLSHGTTGMLITFYRDLGHENTVGYINNVKFEMGKAGSNILGVHLEGPYLNPVYGSGGAYETPVDPVKYKEFAESGIIRQWSYAPEVEGTDEFLKYIVSMGIVPAIGHSCASPDDVNRAADGGAKIVTHMFDATDASIKPTRWGGTIETTFNCACLLRDELYCEIICDKGGIHVRPEMVKLAIKAAGIDRIVGITDSSYGFNPDGTRPPEDDLDVSFVNGELAGSKLTMDAVARNFKALGLSLIDVFKVVSANPAKAIRMSDVVGSLREGRRGDILIIDEDINVKEVIKANI